MIWQWGWWFDDDWVWWGLVACGLETIQNWEGSQVSGTDGQNRRNIFMKWLLCLMHTFFGLCVNVICLSLTFVNVNISVNIKSISQAVQPRCAERVNIKHTLEKSQTSATNTAQPRFVNIGVSIKPLRLPREHRRSKGHCPFLDSA